MHTAQQQHAHSTAAAAACTQHSSNMHTAQQQHAFSPAAAQTHTHTHTAQQQHAHSTAAARTQHISNNTSRQSNLSSAPISSTTRRAVHAKTILIFPRKLLVRHVRCCTLTVSEAEQHSDADCCTHTQSKHDQQGDLRFVCKVCRNVEYQRHKARCTYVPISTLTSRASMTSRETCVLYARYAEMLNIKETRLSARMCRFPHSHPGQA